jgi:glycosyltransferase involved in cell wall biosynthesis
MESAYKKQPIAILIPMYNEERMAALCIDAVVKEMKKLASMYSIKLFIINDGSQDKTSAILKQKEKQYKKHLIVISYKKNKGYGAALQIGIKKALLMQYAWVIHMDSDLTNDPKYIKDFVKYVHLSFDCIKASRYIRGGRVKNVQFYRRFISTVGNKVASILFHIGIQDCTNGFRMVRLEKLKDIAFRENNFSIILEELYYLKKNKATFTEIPYTLTARTKSVSHFTYKPKIFFDYFKYVVKAMLL